MTYTPDDEEWDKFVGQFRMGINNILKPLRLYGQDHYVNAATEEIVSQAIQLHLKLSGLDIPYHINWDKLHW